MRWVQFHDRLNILWNCISFGLEWKLTYPSTVVADELSKFAEILNAAHLQPHSLGTLNSSAGISSPSLAFLVVMLPQAHLMSYSSIWLYVSDPATSLSWSLWWFLYSSSVLSCLFLISSASVRSLTFLSFIVPIFAWSFPLVSPLFLKRSIFFIVLLFSSNSFNIHLWRRSYLSLLFSGSLHSIRYIFSFLLCLSLLFFPHLFVKTSQTTTLRSCISFSLQWFGQGLLYNDWTFIHRSSGTV